MVKKTKKLILSAGALLLAGTGLATGVALGIGYKGSAGLAGPAREGVFTKLKALSYGRDWTYSAWYQFIEKGYVSSSWTNKVLRDHEDAVVYASNLAFPLSYSDAFLPNLPSGYRWYMIPTLTVKYGGREASSYVNKVVGSSSGRQAYLQAPSFPAPAVGNGDTLQVVYSSFNDSGVHDGPLVTINFKLTDQAIASGQGANRTIHSDRPVLAGFKRYSRSAQAEPLPPVNQGYEDWGDPEVTFTNAAGKSALLDSFDSLNAGDLLTYTFTARPAVHTFLKPYKLSVNYRVINSRFKEADLAKASGGIVADHDYDYEKMPNAQRLQSDALEEVRELASLYDFSITKVTYRAPDGSLVKNASFPLPSGYEAIFLFSGVPTAMNTDNKAILYTVSYKFRQPTGTQGAWNTYIHAKKVHAGHRFLNLKRQLDPVPSVNPGYKPWKLLISMTKPGSPHKLVSSFEELEANATLWYVYLAEPYLPGLYPYSIRIGYEVVEGSLTDKELQDHAYSRRLDIEGRPGLNMASLANEALADLDRDLGELYAFELIERKVKDQAGHYLDWQKDDDLPSGYEVEFVATGKPTAMNTDNGDMVATLVYKVGRPSTRGVVETIHSPITIQDKLAAYYDFDQMPEKPPTVSDGYGEWITRYWYESPAGAYYPYDPNGSFFHAGGFIWKFLASYPLSDNSLKPNIYRIRYKVVESSTSKEQLEEAFNGTFVFSELEFFANKSNMAFLRKKAEGILSEKLGSLYSLHFDWWKVNISDENRPDPELPVPVGEHVIPPLGRDAYFRFTGTPKAHNASRAQARFAVRFKIVPAYEQGMDSVRFSKIPLPGNLLSLNIYEPSPLDIFYAPERPEVNLYWYEKWDAPLIEGENASGVLTEIGSADQIRDKKYLWYTYTARPRKGAPLRPYTYKVRYQLFDSPLGKTNIENGVRAERFEIPFDFLEGPKPSMLQRESAVKVKGLFLEGFYDFTFQDGVVYDNKGNKLESWKDGELPVGFRYVASWKGVARNKKVNARDFWYYADYSIVAGKVSAPGSDETISSATQSAGADLTPHPAPRLDYAFSSVRYYDRAGVEISEQTVRSYLPGDRFKAVYLYKPLPGLDGPVYKITRLYEVVADWDVQARYVIEDRTSYVRGLTSAPGVRLPLDSGYSKNILVGSRTVEGTVAFSLGAPILVTRYIVAGAGRVPYYVDVKSIVLSFSQQGVYDVVEQATVAGPRLRNGLPEAYLASLGSDYTEWYVNKGEWESERGVRKPFHPNGYYWNFSSGNVLFITYVAFSRRGGRPVLFTVAYRL